MIPSATNHDIEVMNDDESCVLDLNVAERSSLLVTHTTLADGDLTTSKHLKGVFSTGSEPLVINLYFPTRIKQVRVVADNKIQGNGMPDLMESKAVMERKPEQITEQGRVFQSLSRTYLLNAA